MFSLLLFAVLLPSVSVRAENVLPLAQARDTGSAVQTGVWTSNFAAAKSYADKNHIPLLVYWGYTACGQCRAYRKAALESEVFLKWMRDKNMLFCMVVAPSKANSAVKVFAKGNNRGTQLPYVRLYWNEKDGEIHSKCFSGTWKNQPDILLQQIDTFCGNFINTPEYVGGHFLADASNPSARLEMELRTLIPGQSNAAPSVIEVPLIRLADRGATSYAATNLLTVAGLPPIKVLWESGQTNAYVSCSIPAEMLTQKKNIPMNLADAATPQETVETSFITLVDPVENSVSNPYWIGEKDVDGMTNAWGQWTMDLDAAKQAVRSVDTNAYTLAVVSGSLWCPDCFMIDTNLFGSAEFKAWTVENRVIPVLLDIPMSSENRWSLLTHDLSSIRKSGTPYLSRKGISVAAAEEAIARNEKLAYGEWKLPEFAGSRLWVPTMLLLDKEGNIIGRIGDYGKNKPYPAVQSVVNRLDDLIAGDDSFEEADGHWSTTKRHLNRGQSVEGSISSADLDDVWELDAPKGAVHMIAKLDNPDAAGYTLTLFSVTADGSVAEIKRDSVKAQKELLLDTDILPLNQGDRLFLKVTGNRSSFAEKSLNSTLKTYGLSYSTQLKIVDKESVYQAKAGETFPLYVETGCFYKFTVRSATAEDPDSANNPDLLKWPDDLVETSTTGVYTSKVSGAVEFMVKEEAGEVLFSYRIFVPGTVSFTYPEQTVREDIGKAKVTLERKGGKSGEYRVILSVGTGTTAVAGTHYAFQSEEIIWKDGEEGTKDIYVPIIFTSWHNDETHVDLVATVGESALTHRINIVDIPIPQFDKASYNCEVFLNEEIEPIVCKVSTSTGKRPSFKRSGKLPRGLTYKLSGNAIVITGRPTRLETTTFTIQARDGRIASETVNIVISVCPYKGGYFMADEGNPFDRLQIEKQTNPQIQAFPIEVPLTRKTDNGAVNYLATNLLTVAGMDPVLVEWQPNQTNIYVGCDIPVNMLSETKRIPITLAPFENPQKIADTSFIEVVDPVENSVSNPYWIGEKDADGMTNAWGQWTMDLDAAKQAVRSVDTNAYTLAVVSGSLWCPDCFMIDTNLFGSAEFKAWTVENRVIPVLLDIPMSSVNRWSLLTHDLSYIRKSGTPYLSRKGISVAAAEEAIARNEKLAYEEWKLPEFTGSRLWVPTMLLLDKEGNIIGRIGDYGKNKPYPVVQSVVNRLDDLIAGDDSFEEADGHWSTTKRHLALGESVEGTLSSADLDDVWELDASRGAVRLTASLANTEKAKYELQLFSQNADGVKKLAESKGTNEVITLEADLAPFTEGDRLFLKVTGNTVYFAEKSLNSTLRPYALSYSTQLLTLDKESVYTAKALETFSMNVSTGRFYKILVCPAGSQDPESANDPALLTWPDDLVETQTTGIYTSKVSGAVQFTVAKEEPQEVLFSYRIFEPGTIGFEKNAQRILEIDTEAKLSLKRTGGVSGPLSVVIKLDPAYPAEGVHYRWTKDVTVEWEDGEGGLKEIGLPFELIQNLEKLDEEETIKLNLEGTAVGNQTLAITFYDTDKPVFASKEFETEVLYTHIAYNKAYTVYNITDPRRASLRRKSGSMPSGIRTTYDRRVTPLQLVFSGTPSRTSTNEVSYSFSERRSNGVSEGDPSTFRFEVRDIKSVAPAYGETLNLKELPVFAKGETDTILVGMANLTLSRSGRLSVRYRSIAKSSTSISFTWNEVDVDKSELRGHGEDRYGVKCDVVLDAKTGVLKSFTILDPNCPMASGDKVLNVALIPQVWSREHTASDYLGYYTVALPYAELIDAPENAEWLDPVKKEAFIPTGSGYLTLTLSKGDLYTGRVRYSGLFPNGSSISGYAYLAECEKSAMLPIFIRTSRDVLGTTLIIKPGATVDTPKAVFATEKDFEEQISGENVSLGTVSSSTVVPFIETIPYWLHAETSGYSFVLKFDVYGSYYGGVLKDCCIQSMGTTIFKMDVCREQKCWKPAYSPLYGSFQGFDAVDVEVSSDNKIQIKRVPGLRLPSMRFSSRTGIINGSLRLDFENRQVSASYKGVLTPGWGDCPDCMDIDVAQPFFTGSCWFTDRYLNPENKRNYSVRRSVSIDMYPNTTQTPADQTVE